MSTEHKQRDSLILIDSEGGMYTDIDTSGNSKNCTSLLSTQEDVYSESNKESDSFEKHQLKTTKDYEEISIINRIPKDHNRLVQEISQHSSNHVHLKPSSIRELLVDPRVPYTLALYLQLISNTILISIIFYLIYNFITTIQTDVNQKFETTKLDITHEISFCSREYIRNKCSTRVPALEKECTELEKCMNRDPQLIAKSKITAETFAEIINGFIGKISWKSLILINGLIFGGLILSNVVFGNYRATTFQQEQDKIIELERKVKQQELMIKEYEKGQLQIT